MRQQRGTGTSGNTAAGVPSSAWSPFRSTAFTVLWLATVVSNVGVWMQNAAAPGHGEESCRSYSSNFFEAVTMRQAASFCKDGVDRQRTLELLDAEIEAFNDLIASQCRG